MTAARPLVALALSLLAVAPAALASPFWPGPHAGTIEQGETNRHIYALFYASQPCSQLPTVQTLALVYAPPSDTLTLTVGTQSAVGHDGLAILTVEKAPCAQFLIYVEGTAVASVAAYDVVQAFTPDA